MNDFLFIGALLSTKEAISRIRENDVVNLARELVRIRSINPPGLEKEAADFTEEKLIELGLTVDKYEVYPGRPNVVGRLKGTSGTPILMMNCHLDVVPPGNKDFWSFKPFGGEVKNRRLYGRGASDMKGAIASVVTAVKSLIESEIELEGDLIVALVVDEEISGLGTQSLIDNGYRADMAVVAEPTMLQVCIAHKGVAHIEVITKGESAHASTPYKGSNAIYKMMKVISSFEKFSSELEQRIHPLVGSCTLNVCTIEGGTKVNIIPDFCRIEIDRRTIPGEPLKNVEQEINELVTRLRSEDPSLNIEYTLTHMLEPAEIKANESLVKIALESVKKITGSDYGIGGFVATTDMHILVNQARIPTIILGPGSINEAHKIDEFVDTKQLVNAAKIYTHLIAHSLSHSKNPFH